MRGSRTVRIGLVVAVMALLLAACRFSNSTLITITDGAAATPYPSTIHPNFIGDLVGGCVGDLNVKLHGVTHPNPDDIDILLAGPNGQTVVLMSDVGGTSPVSGVDLTFDDEAAGSLPDAAQIVTGAYRPTDFDTPDAFPAGAPAPPYGTTLSVFDGGQFSGLDWNLYVADDTSNTFSGSIAGGWSMNITQCGQSVPAVVRQSTNWLLRDAVMTGDPTTTFTYGTRPLTPFFGDWDGDGSETPGTFEKGVFKLSNTYGGPAEGGDYTFTFGDSRGYPVAGDFNGDFRDDVGVFRNGTWEFHLTGGGTLPTITGFGTGTWPATVPIAGNWDGDSIDGIGFVKAGQWTFRPDVAANGTTDSTRAYGPTSGAYPVVGAWDGEADRPGYKVGSTWTVEECPSICADFSFDYGLPSDLPLSWRAAFPGGVT
ncbi:MAG: hypothetical protein QOH36_1596 [Actinomycetota bacterium]|nr:hypothetical protein [Actinomycetota bacterium]